MTFLDIVVRQRYGSYVTQTVHRVSASCTAGAQQAAERFGQKYFGPSFIAVEELAGPRDAQSTNWRVQADNKAYAWCWASGLIEFKGHLPVEEGAVAFASGPQARTGKGRRRCGQTRSWERRPGSCWSREFRRPKTSRTA
jgi:hypothetical protein